MNIKFLVCVSLFIALLCHLIFFNVFTFVFPIKADAPKPKFFFLGPILTQKDVQYISAKKHISGLQSMMKNFNPSESLPPGKQSEEEDQQTNPFAIQTINKPIASQTDQGQKKIILKSTFEIDSEADPVQKPEAEQHHDRELKIQPYRPLKFRSP